MEFESVCGICDNWCFPGEGESYLDLWPGKYVCLKLSAHEDGTDEPEEVCWRCKVKIIKRLVEEEEKE